jgi:hypothetical protein
MTEEISKKIDGTEYFASINIPDNWDTIEEFTDWYFNTRMPMMIPWNAGVMQTDDATAMCIFRKGHYQVELYLILAGMQVKQHAHPGVEVITVYLGGGNYLGTKSTHDISKHWGTIYKKLANGEYHGSDEISKKSTGYAILAIQKWDNIDEMSSASIQWRGNTAGPIQEELIRKHRPNALVNSGYADIDPDGR